MRKYCIVVLFFLLVLGGPAIQVMAQNIEIPDELGLLEHHGLPMMLFEATSGEILYANPAAESFYGFNKDQLLTMNVGQMNGMSQEELESHLKSVTGEGEHIFQARNRLADGRIVPVEIHAYPYVMGNQRVLFSIVRDMSEEKAMGQRTRMMTIGLLLSMILVILILLFLRSLQKHNLQAIEEKNENLNVLNRELKNFFALRRSFIDADDSEIYLKDDQLRYVFVNQAFERSHQLKEEEIVGKKDEDLHEQALAVQIKKSDLQVLQEMKTLNREIAWGNRIYKTTKFPVALENGAYGVGAYVTDVTEARESQRLLKMKVQRDQLLLSILEQTFDRSKERLDYVLAETIKLTQSQIGYLFLYDEAREEFVIESWSEGVMEGCRVDQPPQRYQLRETGLWGEAVRQKKPLIYNDLKDPSIPRKGYPKGHMELFRFLTLPIIMDGHIKAVAGFANKETPYDQDDIYQVSLIMKGVWGDIERAQREEDLAEANQALEAKENHLQLILNSAAEGIYGIDRQGRCTFINVSGLKMLGYDQPEALIGKNIHQLIHHSYKDGRPYPEKECKMLSTFSRGEKIHVSDEVFWRSDRTPLEVEYFSYPQVNAQGVVGAVVTFVDITRRNKLEEEMRFISFHDALTGLYNRRYFEAELSRLEGSRSMPISIIVADINGLKMTNDVFGHEAGDRLIKTFSEVLRHVCRNEDVIARIGGDEFAVVLPNTPAEGAQSVVERVQAELKKLDHMEFIVSATMGMAVKTEVDKSLKDVHKEADDEMYRLKIDARLIFERESLHHLLNQLYRQKPQLKRHHQLTAHAAVQLARSHQRSVQEVKYLEEGAQIHDIGMVGLEMPLKHHSERGYLIVKSLPRYAHLAHMIRYHHAHWDGSGYPTGLAGEKIPQQGRMLAVSNMYATLFESMPGQDEVQHGKRIERMMALSGRVLDPSMVHRFIAEVIPNLDKEEGSPYRQK